MSMMIPTCFAAGTLIATRNGQVPVEDLRLGDLVATATSGFQPVRWIGWRHVVLAGLPEPERRRNTPILLAAGSLDDQVPFRDLVVSACHGIIADHRFLPAGSLVNGRDIVPLDALGSVTYYHIELDAFEILLANGVGAESFVDVGNRSTFDHHLGEVALAASSSCA